MFLYRNSFFTLCPKSGREAAKWNFLFLASSGGHGEPRKRKWRVSAEKGLSTEKLNKLDKYLFLYEILFKQVQFLLIFMLCVIGAGCGLGNMLIPHKEEPDFDRDSTQVQEINSSTSYRVQIGMFDTMDEAVKMAESARSTIEYPVYLEYIPPFYRVRVGDFERKIDAEECVIFLKQHGFNDSRYVFKRIDSQ